MLAALWLELLDELLEWFVTGSHINEVVYEWNHLPLPLRWAAAGFILLFIEQHMRRVIPILPAAAAFATAIPALLLPERFILFQVFFFLSLTLIGFYYRPLILRKYVGTEDRHPAITARVLGNSGVCMAKIDGCRAPGTVRISGHDWPALEVTGRPVVEGDPVTVVGSHEMTLLVRKDAVLQLEINPLVNRLVGRQATWIGNKSVILAGTVRAASPWPTEATVAVGEVVKIVGVNEGTLFFQRDLEHVHDPDHLVGAIGVCLEPIDGANQPGSTIIGGVTWRARAASEAHKISAGGLARVVEMDGAVLVVENPAPTQPPTAL